MSEKYEGPVCFVGHDHENVDGRQLEAGWHYSVVDGPSGEMPGEKLVLEDDGSYRLAEDGDMSHNERHHRRYVSIEMEDGHPGVQVNEQELAAIQQLLGQMRGE